MWNFLHQGHAEDIVMYHRYAYYVLGKPVLTDGEYDALEREVCERWSINVTREVASDRAVDYPDYVRDGRRPSELDRLRRDWTIQQRWLNNV